MPDPQPRHVADLLQRLQAWNAVAKPGWELPISAGDVAVLIRTLHAYEGARKDAERYAWLRTNPDYMGWEHDFRPDEIDREIDRVIAERAARAAIEGK